MAAAIACLVATAAAASALAQAFPAHSSLLGFAVSAAVLTFAHAWVMPALRLSRLGVRPASVARLALGGPVAGLCVLAGGLCGFCAGGLVLVLCLAVGMVPLGVAWFVNGSNAVASVYPVVLVVAWALAVLCGIFAGGAGSATAAARMYQAAWSVSVPASMLSRESVAGGVAALVAAIGFYSVSQSFPSDPSVGKAALTTAWASLAFSLTSWRRPALPEPASSPAPRSAP